MSNLTNHINAKHIKREGRKKRRRRRKKTMMMIKTNHRIVACYSYI